MGKKLAMVIMLAFVCSINNVHSGSGSKISDLSTKFRYALYLLNDLNTWIIREFLLTPDFQVGTDCPVKFYKGRYYRIYLLNIDDGEDVCGYLCDDVQMLSGSSLPATTPQTTPANTPVVLDSKYNPFFPTDDSNALRIPLSGWNPPVIIGQKLTPTALDMVGEGTQIAPEEIKDALYFYLKKRPGMNENRIFFTHNRASESNIVMVIRRSFPSSREVPGEVPEREYDCLEISIPVGTFEFASVEQLLSMQNEYSACTIPWQQHVIEHGLPDGIEGPCFEPDMIEFSDIALLDCLHELELSWNRSNPIDSPVVERVLGAGITSVAVSLFHNFRSFAFKRLNMTTERKEDAAVVISSARINLLLLSIYGVPVAPMRYEMVHNPEKGHYAIYCIQALYQPEQFADHFLESSDVSVEEKMKLIDTIIHYMNLCDISNGYQLRMDDGFKGYFRVVVDSNYPNYCLINGIWHLIDLSPFFWSVGDHFSEANQHILDMSQSEDYYSFIKSLCTNPVQLYVFFCGRMYRPHQKYSLSPLPDHQRKAGDWLGLYNYALQRVATLPQIIHEFDREQWRQQSAGEECQEKLFWQILVKQRNVDPSNEYLEGVNELVERNEQAGHPVILDGTMEPWQQPPQGYHSFIGSIGYIDPVDYLSAPPEQRRGKQQADIFDITRVRAMVSPESFLSMIFPVTPEKVANRFLFLRYLRIQALMKLLSQNMAEDNNERAANRRQLLRQQRESNPPSPPVIYTHLTAMNDEEMSDFLNLHFNAEYLPVESDGNCMWNAIARVLSKRGIHINPVHLMQTILPNSGDQTEAPEHQQNWGNTDFVAKILRYLDRLSIHVGIVVMQPYGAQMVGVWYGLVDGQLTVQPLDNDPVGIQQAIQNPNNITLVNHQNGNDSNFQVTHWGGIIPLPSAAGTESLLITGEGASEEPVVEHPIATSEEENEPSSKPPRVAFPASEKRDLTPPDSTGPAILSPEIFEHQFHSVTDLSLIGASGYLPHSLPGEAQPLANYRNLLLSLISNYLLMCNKNASGCSHQLDGILSLLPESQNITNQDMQTGSIEPFLHILTALLHWMNPQPVHPAPALTENSLTEITLIFPMIGHRGIPAYAAWRLIMEPSIRGYIHVKRIFIRNLDINSENFSNKRHLHFVTNIPVTPLGHLAWPFQAPMLAQWWLVAPKAHAAWMLGTTIAEHVEPKPEDDSGPNPKDLQRELSDAFSIGRTLISLLLFSKHKY